MHKGIFAAKRTIIYRPLKFEREKGTEKRICSAVLKAIRIEGSNRISPARLQNAPIITVILRGDISLLLCQGLATNVQDKQRIQGTPLIEEIFISSQMYSCYAPSHLPALFRAIYSARKKGLLCFSSIRPRSKVNCFPNRARFRINRTIHSQD